MAPNCAKVGTKVMGDQLDQLASLAPAGRPAAPEEIASAITYLAGDEASFVHGAILDSTAAAAPPSH